MVSARKGLARLALAAVQLACKLAHAARTVQCGAVQCRERARARAGTHVGTRARGSAGSRMQLATAASAASAAVWRAEEAGRRLWRRRRERRRWRGNGGGGAAKAVGGGGGGDGDGGSGGDPAAAAHSERHPWAPVVNRTLAEARGLPFKDKPTQVTSGC